LARVIDNGMKQKSDLTLINNEFKQQKATKEALASEITDMQSELNRKINEANACKQTIKSQDNEIEERQTTIREKDARIDELK
jgi:Tfp pilus assembly protein PilN